MVAMLLPMLALTYNTVTKEAVALLAVQYMVGFIESVHQTS
jgi:hypothetical protein